MRRPGAWPAAVAAGLLATTATAADDAGRFAIEGGGLQTCAAFLAAGDAGSPDIAAYGGWVEGYITALNQQMGGVFDLTPWQSTASLLSLVRSICQSLPPETRYSEAVDALVRLLLPQALTAASEPVGLASDGQATIVYAATIERIQTRLRALGHEVADPAGTFGPDTERALRAYQDARGFPQTGLPDQNTLFALLMRQDG